MYSKVLSLNLLILFEFKTNLSLLENTNESMFPISSELSGAKLNIFVNPASVGKMGIKNP